MSRTTTINPATGEAIAEYPRTDAAGVERAVSRAVEAFRQWRETDPAQRATFLRRLADALDSDAAEAAATITREMGKPISQARGEVGKCVELCLHYAGRASELLAFEEVATEARISGVRLDPLGPILGIMPWNFPYWQVLRWGVPTLLAGNTLILKHADNVLGAAEHIGRLFAAAGAPPGLFADVSLANEDVEPVIRDHRVRGVSLTGSVRAGRAVAANAGDSLKPSVLELGGSDPALILPDADLDAHMDAIVHGRFQNTGQTCIASKRYLVHRSIVDDFTDRLVAAVGRLTLGDPTREGTDLGPLARRDLRDTLAGQLDACRAADLNLIVDGGSQDGPGNFFTPVVVTGATPGSPPFEEELFGPVATVCSCDDVDQMVEWANATDYGLSASVWGGPEDGRRLAARLDVGCVFVNQGVKSDARLPFGGVKDSGYGRELGGYGVRQFANEKTIWVA